VILSLSGPASSVPADQTGDSVQVVRCSGGERAAYTYAVSAHPPPTSINSSDEDIFAGPRHMGAAATRARASGACPLAVLLLHLRVLPPLIIGVGGAINQTQIPVAANSDKQERIK